MVYSTKMGDIWELRKRERTLEESKKMDRRDLTRMLPWHCLRERGGDSIRTKEMFSSRGGGSGWY